MSWQRDIASALAARKAQHRYRYRRVLQSAQSASVVVDGASLLNFSSNDYLGLAKHPKIKAAFIAAVERYGVGSGASHLVSGHSFEHHALEEELASFTSRSRALLFSSGYLANLALLTSFVGKQGAVFEDKLNHASLLDGGLLSGARFRRFLHNDIDSLQKLLSSSDMQRKLIAVDGVFSMDGDCAPLPGLAKLATEYQAILAVDDAHGFGVLGDNGAGSCAKHQLDQAEVPLLMATLGKALGCSGAFVAGSEDVIETLIQFGRSYIYTTATPPAVAAAARQALALVETETWRRERLQSLIGRFGAGAAQIGLPVMASSTPIQPLLLGDSERCLSIAEQLRHKGLLVGAIRPPTVAEGSARLRITLTAAHEESQIDTLLDALASVYAND